MARQLRIEYPGAFYHVMNRGAGRKPIFHDEQFYNLFLALLADLNKNFGIEIHAYCLMGNHYHLLIKTCHANLSIAMKHLNGVYTMRYNRLLKKDGPLFRGRFKSIVVDADEYLLQVSRYIHLNPVEAKLVKNPETYLWSSYKYYCDIKNKPDWLMIEELHSRFSQKNKRLAYQLFVSEGTDQDTHQIYNSSKIPAIIGKDTFCKKIQNALKLKPHKEIPDSKKFLHQCITKEKIIQKMAKHYKCKESDIILGKNKELKKIAVYFCKRLTNATLSEIGHYFSGVSYSGVSQISKRLTLEIKQNIQLAEKIKALESVLSNVKT